jgi:hypothetical protein
LKSFWSEEINLTPEDESYILDLFNDKLWRLNNLYWIKSKRGQVVQFNLNPEQLDFFNNKHNRNVILKARQLGFTTLQCISFLDDICFNANLELGIIAHKLEDAEEFFNGKIKFAFERIPDDVKERFGIKAITDRDGKLELSNGSSVRVSTSFRSGTLQKLHVSEYGKLSKERPMSAREIRTGAFNAVDSSMEITVESTAEGMEGEFYDLWCRAEDNHGKTLTEMDFKPFFYPWWRSPDYRLSTDNVEVPPKLIEYFAMLESEHDIKLDGYQKAWYTKKAEEQKGDEAQEFPSYAEEAFIVSGRPVFDRDAIAAAIKIAKKMPFTQGRFDSSGKFIEDKNGPYKIFKRPQPGRKYAIGGDVAEGLEEGDWSTQSAISKSFEQMASYIDHLHPKLLGGEMMSLGNYYNQALLAPEANNHGISTLDRITDAKYPMIFAREVYDERADKFFKKVGWQTNGKTKPLMLDELILAIEGKGEYKECPLRIYDVPTLRQMLSLKYGPNGEVELNGKDLVVCNAIALQAIKQVHETQAAVYDTARPKTTFKTLEEMLEASEAEESYFD